MACTPSQPLGGGKQEKEENHLKNLTKQGDEHTNKIPVVTINVNGLNLMLSPDGGTLLRGSTGENHRSSAAIISQNLTERFDGVTCQVLYSVSSGV